MNVMTRKWRRHVDADAKSIAKSAKKALRVVIKKLKALAKDIKKKYGPMQSNEKIIRAIKILLSVYLGNSGVLDGVHILKSIPDIIKKYVELKNKNGIGAASFGVGVASIIGISNVTLKLLMSYKLAKSAAK